MMRTSDREPPFFLNSRGGRTGGACVFGLGDWLPLGGPTASSSLKNDSTRGRPFTPGGGGAEGIPIRISASRVDS